MKKVCQCLGIIEHNFLEEYKLSNASFRNEVMKLRKWFPVNKSTYGVSNFPRKVVKFSEELFYYGKNNEEFFCREDI